MEFSLRSEGGKATIKLILPNGKDGDRLLLNNPKPMSEKTEGGRLSPINQKKEGDRTSKRVIVGE